MRGVNKMMRRTLTTSEAAHVLGIDPCSLRKYERQKLIFATRDGVTKWRRFSIVEVERFLKVLDGVAQATNK